ncbi:MAG: hypothetical protein R3C56_04315 [Pirellulaceae bacterium]
MATTWFEEGIEKGIERGIEQGERQFALKMLRQTFRQRYRRSTRVAQWLLESLAELIDRGPTKSTPWSLLTRASETNRIQQLRSTRQEGRHLAACSSLATASILVHDAQDERS